jgi:L-asparaginase
VVDVGSENGVMDDSLVFSIGGALVGQVEEVSSKTSKVVMFSSVGEETEAAVERTGESIKVVGTGGGTLQAEVAQEMDITVDDVVVLPDFGGLVVASVAYTAAALSFALQNLSKPVVLTGSLMPIDDIGSDARMNLTYAIQAAQLDIAEVCIVLGPRVLRGSRAKKADQSILQTFDSPRFPPLAEFNTAVSLHPWRTVRRKRSLVVEPDFDPNVASLTLHPGMPMLQADALLDAKPHGIVLRAYGLGMLPEYLYPWLRKVTKMNIPIVITSQLLRGTIDLHLYRKQLTLEELGIISGMDMTYECAVVKLMWALKQSTNVRRIRELMEKNLTGELSETN